MAWFKKKQSPIEKRLEELNQQIAELETQARRQEEAAVRRAAQPSESETDGQNQIVAPTEPEIEKPAPDKSAHRPRFRTTVTPSGVSPVHGIEPHEVDFFARRDKPVDFSLEQGQSSPAKSSEAKKDSAETQAPQSHGFLDDILRLFHKPKSPPSRARLAYLTTGSFKRLKPLKYERRVARNRAIVLILILAVVVVLLARCVTRS